MGVVRAFLFAVAAAAIISAPLYAQNIPARIDSTTSARLAQLALDCVHREYPNRISHTLQSDADMRPPRKLTPSFFGCYDWHSAVHAHWMLARLTHLYPKTKFGIRARTTLARSLSRTNIRSEINFLKGKAGESFERPYGLAWLLALSAELRTWNDDSALAWKTALSPLETEAAARLKLWLPKLRYPIRTGEHNQTAFALGLVWDWAQTAKDTAMLDLLRSKASWFYARDRNCPLSYEPSGEDFLSPCLAEADFMRRVLSSDKNTFAAWLTLFLPNITCNSSKIWLPIADVTDRTDPKLAHLDGLNLSRAWMLEGISTGLPPGDCRIATLRKTAAAHQKTSLPAITSKHYVGSHWLGTFAVYLLSNAGR